MVVVIDDHVMQAETIACALGVEGLEHRISRDDAAGLDLVRSLPADLVLLGVSHPASRGIETCRRVREFSDAYLIILADGDSATERVAGLAAGADDYIVSPFDLPEVIGRIRAMRRRPRTSGPPTEELRHFGALTIDSSAHEVRVDDIPVDLSRTEFQLLDALAGEPRVIFSRGQLIERVWGPNWIGDDHVVNVHISNLRRKLGDDIHCPRFVLTIRGCGYRMGGGQFTSQHQLPVRVA